MQEDYSAYIGQGHNRPEEMQEIIALAKAQHMAEIKVEKAEAFLKTVKEELREISEQKLPQKMEALGLPEFKTDEGITVSVSEKIRASIPVENRPKAYSWLEENKFDGMIKTTVTIAFKRGDLENAKKLATALQSSGHIANVERKIEPMTLLSFVKEHLRAGKDIPLDLFGVYRQHISEVEIKN